ncbi:MAG: hypothetical protein FJZ01_00265 [Candidatus Sericytochromatia bacterium]|nr:hypothetical protein [Candidatus Tanganyikabacteria bacterium]
MAEFTVGRHARKFGVAAVLEAVSDVSFPLSRERLILLCGDREVEVRPGTRRKLGDLVSRCAECEDFNSAEDLISQIESEMVTT